jgi:hypothetical protein
VGRRLSTLFVLCLMTGLVASSSAVAAESSDPESTCQLANAAGSAVDRAAADGGGGKPRAAKKGKGKGKKQQDQSEEVTLQADPGSANRVVNLGDDREAEEVTLRVNVSPQVSKSFVKELEVVAEPFTNSSETGETVTFPEPEFSKLDVSGNGKRVTFTMCIDAPNDLPAGKYTSALLLEGPPSVEEAVMTVTLNAKDGHGFFLAAFVTAALAFLILLYKGAGEKRASRIAAAEKKSDNEREVAVRAAEGWGNAMWSCILDLGWLFPTLASIGAAFALLYAAYDSNPAWGEGGIVTNAIALIGTGLAAVGAKAIFTQNPTVR